MLEDSGSNPLDPETGRHDAEGDDEYRIYSRRVPHANATQLSFRKAITSAVLGNTSVEHEVHRCSITGSREVIGMGIMVDTTSAC
ncbi:hypothetical protein CDAR_594571 [Caerostris darwini]|uniref:Uncharacterized protein n=1 Tax=Caerostris darwini TaxID=1538125 RepID=A0AAV4WVE1_9ARAC|nr:hypothetical protein CDAR_594571 [Caerostris darwini]